MEAQPEAAAAATKRLPPSLRMEEFSWDGLVLLQIALLQQSPASVKHQLLDQESGEQDWGGSALGCCNDPRCTNKAGMREVGLLVGGDRPTHGVCSGCRVMCSCCRTCLVAAWPLHHQNCIHVRHEGTIAKR